MISKFTNSLRVYGGAIAMGHILLFITLFPKTSLILFFVLVPMTYISIMMTMIREIHKAEGFDVGDHYMTSVSLDEYGIPYYYMESPLDWDYDIGIH